MLPRRAEGADGARRRAPFHLSERPLLAKRRVERAGDGDGPNGAASACICGKGFSPLSRAADHFLSSLTKTRRPINALSGIPDLLS